MITLKSADVEVRNIHFCTKDEDAVALFGCSPESDSDDYFRSEKILAFLWVEDSKGNCYMIALNYDLDDVSEFDEFFRLDSEQEIFNNEEFLNECAKEHMKKQKIPFNEFPQSN